jgi:DNA-binding NarL/FixJ family response regulator
MFAAPHFVVVDYHSESRYLLVRTLLRKFPGTTISEFDEATDALTLVERERVAVIIAHRTFDVPGIELVRLFRVADPNVPIVMVSGIDRARAALAAGANRFLHYDEWLRIGSVVAELLDSSKSPFPAQGQTELAASDE